MVARGIKNENLLPCPFCGSDAIMSGYSRKNGGEDWYIGCSRDNCIEFDTKFKCMVDAENAWNRRATPLEPTLDKIRAEIEQHRYGLVNDGLDIALNIIDKCKAESER